MRPRDYIEIKKEILGGVPCLLVKPKANLEKIPTLFHYHGWSSRKEGHQFLATTMAQYGYQVILPDSNFHGERNPLEEYNSENITEYFWTIVKQSVDEFQEIREEAQSKHAVDPESIAVSGSSMGGYITSSIFAQNPDIKSLITFNGGSSLWKTKELVSDKLEIDLESKIDREEMEKYDPLTYKDSFYPRTILMLHGDADTSVPLEIQKYVLEEVTPLYEDKTKIKLEVYKNMNHHISIRMVESAVSWLEKYL